MWGVNYPALLKLYSVSELVANFVSPPTKLVRQVSGILGKWEREQEREWELVKFIKLTSSEDYRTMYDWCHCTHSTGLASVLLEEYKTHKLYQFSILSLLTLLAFTKLADKINNMVKAVSSIVVYYNVLAHFNHKHLYNKNSHC